MYNYNTPDYHTNLAPGMMGGGNPMDIGTMTHGSGYQSSAPSYIPQIPQLGSSGGGFGDWMKNNGGSAMGGAGSIFSGLMKLFGGGGKMPQMNNPANAAMPYLNQIPDMMKGYYSPYINAGNRAMGSLEGQYGQTSAQLPGMINQYKGMAGLQPSVTNQYQQMMNDPSGVLNKLGQGFQSSPGYGFQRQQGQDAINRAAAAGGGLGSPGEMQEMAKFTQGLANQDYGNYMNRATGMLSGALSGLDQQSQTGMEGLHNLYNTGHQGQQMLNQMGFQGSNELAQSLANTLMSQGNLAYQGQNTDNMNNMLRYMMKQGQGQNKMGGLSDIFSGASSLIPLIFGGGGK